VIASLLAVLFGPADVLADPDIDTQTNAARAQSGLASLVSRADIAQVALTRAQQVTQVWGHPTDWQWLFDAIPGCERVLGENIASYTTGYEPAGWPVSAWMVSPGHRANILGGWTWMGSARAYANGKTYAVQIFAGACADPLGAQPPIAGPLPDAAMSAPE